MLLCGTPAMLFFFFGGGATRVVLVHSASVGRRRTHVGWRTHVVARGYSLGVWSSILVGVWSSILLGVRPSILMGVRASTLIGVWPSILCCLVRHWGGHLFEHPGSARFPSSQSSLICLNCVVYY
ncbi:hypothetical protein TorRG33x02_052070 [Trema orientale]|uniref:Transmembrane protein n=1 Tax=Trema orientale TaxID=63057 RepID=A0A2P5FMH0_TREOI|nr:hypothetical protein TorRG33x02_052070 [Trema orientale]